MQALRQWSVRHVSVLKRVYDAGARLAPHLWRPLMGYRNDEMLAEAIDESGVRCEVETRLQRRIGWCSFLGQKCITN
jgi:hypothetical protein